MRQRLLGWLGLVGLAVAWACGKESVGVVTGIGVLPRHCYSDCSQIRSGSIQTCIQSGSQAYASAISRPTISLARVVPAMTSSKRLTPRNNRRRRKAVVVARRRTEVL